MTATIGETATLAHGYTMDDLERLTRSASKASRAGMALDHEERWAVAYHAIVEQLYTVVAPPAPVDLVRAGMNAVQKEAGKVLQSHGQNTTTKETGPRAVAYWLPRGGHYDFTDRVVERVALWQILGQLTDLEYEAVATLAVMGQPAAAADALGITLVNFRERLRQGRLKAKVLWVAPDSPVAPISKEQLEVWCRSGHRREDHSYRSERGLWVCRRCARNAARRKVARGEAGFQRRHDEDDAA